MYYIECEGSVILSSVGLSKSFNVWALGFWVSELSRLHPYLVCIEEQGFNSVDTRARLRVLKFVGFMVPSGEKTDSP